MSAIYKFVRLLTVALLLVMASASAFAITYGITPATSTDGKFRISWSNGGGTYVELWQVGVGKITTVTGSSGYWDGSFSASGRYTYYLNTCNPYYGGTISCTPTSYFYVDVNIALGVPQYLGTTDGATSYDGSYAVTWTAPASGTPTYYQWQENNSGIWNNVGLSTNSGVMTRASGFYRYQVQACNASSCSTSATLGVSVDLNTIPTVYPSVTTSADGNYTVGWGNGHLNGSDFAQVWVYEDGNPKWVYGTSPISGSVYITPIAYNKTTQGAHSYYVRACNGSNFVGPSALPDPNTGTCQNSNTVQVVTDFPSPGTAAPITFANVEGGYDTDGSFSFSWPAIAYATSSNVRYGLVGGGKNAFQAVGTSFSVSGLTDGVWEFEIQACNNVSECTSTLVTQQVKRIPLAPQNFGSSDGSSSYDGSYNLSWTAPAIGTVDYYQWKEGSGGWNNVGTSLSSSTIAHINGSYSYQVQACNSAGCGAIAYFSINVDINTPPTIYPSVSTSINGNYSVGWGNGHFNGQNFTQVWVYEDGSPTWVFGTTPLGGSAYLTPVSYTKTTQATRSYYVHACYGVNYSGPSAIPDPATGTCQNSNVVQVVTDFPTPGTAGPITFANVENGYDTDGSFSFSWPAVTYATSYSVRYGLVGSGKNAFQPTGTSFSIAGLTDGVWEFEIQVCNSVSECSSTLVTQQVKRIPSTPQGFGSSDGSSSYDGSYNLSWSAPAIGAVDYYQWRENNGSWNNVGTAGASAVINHSNGSYSYQVQACNSAGCGLPIGFTITVDINTPPTIYPSTSTSTNGSYTVGWGNGHFNGQNFTHVWVYEDGASTWVYGTSPVSSPANISSVAYTKTTQATRSYYVHACYGVNYVGPSALPDPNTGTCQNSNTVQVVTDFPTPGTAGPITFANLESPYDTDGNFSLSWTGVTYATTYNVRYGKSGTPAGSKAVATVATPAFTPPAGLADGVWEFEIQTCNQVPECSAWSTVTSVTVKRTPSPPLNISSNKGAASYDGTYNLTWAAPSSGTVSYYQWREGNGSWTNVGLALSSSSITHSNGSYSYQVQACNDANICGIPAGFTMVVDINTPPTIYPSATTSTNGIYTVGWGNGHLNGQNFTHVWVYEDGAPTWVYGTSPVSSPANISPVAYTKTTQATRSYYVHACYGVSYNGPSALPDPNTGNCQNSNTVQVITDFPTPSNVTVTFTGVEGTYDTNGNFSLAWSAVPNGISYSIRYGKAGSAKSAAQTITSPYTFTPAANLADGVWEFEIQACNSVSECSTTLVSKEVKRIPSGPRSFNSTDGTASYDGSYNLTWVASATGTVEYYQWQEGSNAYISAGTALTSTTITHSSGTYVYHLQACNAAGCSGIATLTIKIMPVTAPTSIAATLDQTTGIPTLSWDPVPNVGSYQVQTLLNGQNLGSPATVNTTSTQLAAVTQVGNYSYSVKACAMVGGVQQCATGTSNIVTPQVPNTPMLSAPLSSSNGAFTVNWSSSIGATTYELFENNVSIQKTGDLQKSFSVLTAKQSGAYSYQVRACRVVCSPLSNLITTIVQLSGPPAVPATPVASVFSNRWRISWTGVSGATRYSLVEVNAGQTKTVDLTSNVYFPTVTGATTYKVQACNAIGCSAFSAQLTANLNPASLSSSSAGANSSGANSSGGGGNNSSNASSVLDSTQPQIALTDGNVVETFPGTIPDSPIIVGATAGQFRVDESGAATYTVPISTPAGVAGVQPQVALTYSSNGGNGIVGQGWSLNGLSAITRCRQTLIQDGKSVPITWSADDRFCYNGQRLMVVSGTYGAPGSTYRTEVDSFVDVTAVGGTAGHPQYFTVEAKDGSMSYFGYSADSKVSGSSTAVATTTLSWNINRFRDSAGNSIDYNYEGSNNERRISSINYAFPSTNAGTAAQRSDGKASVSFAYDTRSDTSSSYVTGYQFNQSKRLTKVTVLNEGAEARTYTLGYMPETSVESDRYYNKASRLQSVQECKGSTCLNPLTFKWGGGSHIAFGVTPDQVVTYASAPSGQYVVNAIYPDINGDGRQDLAYLMYEKSIGTDIHDINKAEMSVHIKCVNVACAYTTPETIIRFTTNDYTKVHLASLDYNADGRQDIAIYDGASWKIYMSQPQSNNTWVISGLPLVDSALTDENTSFIDYNGDGLMDAITSDGYIPLVVDTTKPISSSLRYKFGTPVRFVQADLSAFPEVVADVGPPPGEASNCVLDRTWKILPGTMGDFNGDGVTDFVINYTDIYTCEHGRSTSYTSVYPYAMIVRDGKLSRFSTTMQAPYGGFYAVDLNGDGLSDLVTLGTGNKVSYQLSTGAGLQAPTDWVNLPQSPGLGKPAAVPQFLDYNGDGTTDIAWYDDNSKRISARMWGSTTDTVVKDNADIGQNSSAYLMDMNGDGILDAIFISSTELKGYTGAMAVKIPDEPCVNINTERGPMCVMGPPAGSAAVPGNEQTTGIVSINNGMDNITHIYYSTLAYSGRYTTTNANPGTPPTVEPCNPNNPRCPTIPVYTLDAAGFYSRLNGGWSLPTSSTVLQPDKTFSTTNDSKVAPVLEVNGNMRIVITVDSSLPVAGASPGAVVANGTARVDYYYGEAKMQASGRGFLGFNTLKTIATPYGVNDLDAGITTITTYRQDFPFNGSPLSTVVYSNSKASPTILSVAKTTWAAFSDPAKGIYRPYMASTEENSYSYNSGALLQTVTTSTNMDTDNNGSTGNVADITVVTSGSGLTSTKTTTNTYSTDDWERRKGRLTSVEVTTNGGEKRTSGFSYYGYSDGNLRGLLKTETIEPSGDVSQKLATIYTYDSFGNKKSAATTGRNAYGVDETRTTTNTYSTDGRYLTATLNSLGQSTRITDRNALGQPTASSDINGVNTQIYYDALGNEYLRSSSTGAWVRTDTTYCAVNSSGVNTDCPVTAKYYTRKQASGGGVTVEYFDKLGRTVRLSKLGFNGKFVYVDTEYDVQNHIARQSAPYYSDAAPAGWTEYTYDVLGRPTRVTTPDGKSSTSVYTDLTTVITNPLGKTVTETRNGLGKLMQVTDAMGNTITYSYTSKGDLQSALTHAIEGNTALVLMCYDNLGRKIGMMDEDKGGFKATLKSCTGFSPSPAPTGWWTYQYDAFGELIKQTDPKGQTSTLGYDSVGRMVSRLDKLVDGTVDANTAWFYDTPLGVTPPVSGSTWPATPTNGRLTAVIMSTNATALTSGSCGGQNHCTLYTYDNQARLSDTTVFLPGDSTGFMTGTRFDSIGRPYQQYDGLNSILGVSGIQTQYNQYGYAFQTVNLQDRTLLSRTTEMNARGQITNELRGNGLVTTNTYNDKTGLLLTQVANNGVGADVQNNTYDWDDVGNLRSRTSAGKTMANTTRTLTESFAYDDLNRLIRSDIGGITNTHKCAANDVTYDGLGNIKCKGNMSGYNYASNAGPHAVTSATLNDGTTTQYTYTYDANGNQISDGVGNGRTLTYTSYDLVKTISKGGNTSEYQYAPDRMRWQRKDTKSGVITTTSYIGNLERIQVNNSTTVEWKRYVGGAIFTYKLDANMNQLTGSDSYDRRFVYTDHLGSLDVITSSHGSLSTDAGILTNRVSYDAWGSRRNGATWAILTPADRVSELSMKSYSGVPFTQPVTTRGFTGHEMADDFGIINMNGRIYDPLLGRFLQADPIIDGVKNTQGYNRYSYVQNNPLNASDPSGFSSLRQWVGTVVAVIITVICDGTCGPAVFALLGAAQAAANKQNIFLGALTGAIGGVLGGAYGFGWQGFFIRGFAGGVSSVMMGGKFGNGFISAGLSSLVPTTGNFLKDFAINTIAGGTISELTGGKFANGAASAAASYILNSAAQKIAAGGGESIISSGGRASGSNDSSLEGVDTNKVSDEVVDYVTNDMNKYKKGFRNKEFFGVIYKKDGELDSVVVDGPKCASEMECIFPNDRVQKAFDEVKRLKGKVIGEWHNHPLDSGSYSMSPADMDSANSTYRQIHRTYRAFFSSPVGTIYEWNTSIQPVKGWYVPILNTKVKVGSFEP